MITALRSMILALFFFTISAKAYTQSAPIDYTQQLKMPSVVPPSPDAAGIGKFGSIPVSYSTGVPDISIPIWTIKCSTLNWPVSLSYHASGIKVDEIASSCGLGWSLVAPGVITRSVVGLPDGQYSNAPPYTSLTNFNNPTFLYSVLDGITDAEQDIFDYSFNGRSGKFIINQDGSIFQIPLSNLKITTSGSSINSFTITDENGITYLFDQKESTTTQTYPISTYSAYTSSWYLSRVDMPDKNNNIQFSYASVGYSTQLFTTFSQAIGAKYTGYPIPLLTNLNSKSNTTISTTINMLKLSGITFPNGSLTPLYDPTARLDIGAGNNITNKLIGITINQVINSISSQLKKFTLYQSYFFYNPTGSPTSPNQYRLKLDSVSESGLSSATTPKKYKFEYNSTPMVPRENFGQDIWGFNNGKYNNPSLMQSENVVFPSVNGIPTNYLVGDADRSVDTNQMQACTLNAITWPTGGKTTFAFEPHAYLAGLDNITSSEYETHVFGDQGASPQISSTTFTYPSTALATDTRVIVNMSMYQYAGVTQPSQVTIQDLTTGTEIYHRNHLNPYQPLSIDEPLNLLAGHNYQSKAYVYTSISNYQLTASIKVTWNNFVSQSVIKRGGGLRIKQIKNYTGNGFIAGTESYLYDTAITLTPASAINRTYSDVIYRLGIPAGNCTYYISQLCRVYNSGSVYQISTAMGSPMLYKKIQKITTDSVTGALNGMSEYIYDVFTNEWYPGSGSYRLVPFVSDDWENGFLKSQTDYKFANNAYAIVKKTVNNYSLYKVSQMFALRVQPHYIIEGCYYRTLTDASSISYDADIPYNYPISSGSKRLTETIETAYDDNGNTIDTHTYNEYMSDKYDFATKTTMIDSKGNYDSVKIKRSTDFSATGNVYEKMEQRNIISPVIEQKSYNDATLLNTVKSNYRDWNGDGKIIALDTVQSAFYNNPLQTRLRYIGYDTRNNVLSVKRDLDIPMAYEWDYNYQLPVAEVSNASQSEIAYTSFEADGKGNWTFNGTPISDYNPPTGNKSYDLSSGDITKGSLISSQTYALTYWSRSGPQSVSTQSTAVPVSVTGINVNGWVYYKYKVSNATSVAISGSGVIDELRLYPIDAQMTTYTYDPLIGKTSECSKNNDITYFEYDAFGRLKTIKDQNRNVLKKYCYNYAGQVASCSVAPVSVTLKSVNQGVGSGFTATYTNVNTGAITVYNVSGVATTPQPLTYSSGTIPLTSGNYNLTIAKAGNATLYTFGSGCGSMTTDGTSATFYNISISLSTCNQISLLNIP